MTKLEELAYALAISAPAKPTAHQIQVNVPIWIVNEIRALLDEAGFDWKKAIKTRDSILRPAADLSGESSREGDRP